MIVVLSRGGFCPKDRRQAEGLVALHRELEVAYCHPSSTPDNCIARARRSSLRELSIVRSISRGGSDMRLRGELDRYNQCRRAASGVARRYVRPPANRSSSRPASNTVSGKPRKTKMPALVSTRPSDREPPVVVGLRSRPPESTAPLWLQTRRIARLSSDEQSKFCRVPGVRLGRQGRVRDASSSEAVSRLHRASAAAQ